MKLLEEMPSYLLWLGSMPGNFNIFIFKPLDNLNCHFGGTLTKMISRVNSWILTNSSYL